MNLDAPLGRAGAQVPVARQQHRLRRCLDEPETQAIINRLPCKLALQQFGVPDLRAVGINDMQGSALSTLRARARTGCRDGLDPEARQRAGEESRPHRQNGLEIDREESVCVFAGERRVWRSSPKPRRDIDPGLASVTGPDGRARSRCEGFNNVRQT